MSITIYSTSLCTACNALTAWLDQHKLAYQKKITDTDPAIMEEFMTVNDGMIGVPFTIIRTDDGAETKLSGFNQSEFSKVLGL